MMIYLSLALLLVVAILMAFQSTRAAATETRAIVIDISTERGAGDFAWSPDGKRVAVLNRLYRTVAVYDVATGEVVGKLTDLVGGASSVAFDKEGNVICGPKETTDAAMLWNVDSNSTTFLPGASGNARTKFLHVFSVAPEANILAGWYIIPSGAGQAMQFAVYDLADTKLLMQGGPSGINLVDISPDGKKIAHTDVTGQLNVFDWKANQSVLHIDANANSLTAIAWSPDGKMLATGALVQGFGKNRQTGAYEKLYDTEVLQLWDATTGKRIAALPAKQTLVKEIKFSPDSQFLVASSDGGLVEIFDARPPHAVRATLTPPRGQNVVSSFSPDGKYLARLLVNKKAILIEDVTTLLETGD